MKILGIRIFTGVLATGSDHEDDIDRLIANFKGKHTPQETPSTSNKYAFKSQEAQTVADPPEPSVSQNESTDQTDEFIPQLVQKPGYVPDHSPVNQGVVLHRMLGKSVTDYVYALHRYSVYVQSQYTKPNLSLIQDISLKFDAFESQFTLIRFYASLRSRNLSFIDITYVAALDDRTHYIEEAIKKDYKVKETTYSALVKVMETWFLYIATLFQERGSDVFHPVEYAQLNETLYTLVDQITFVRSMTSSHERIIESMIEFKKIIVDNRARILDLMIKEAYGFSINTLRVLMYDWSNMFSMSMDRARDRMGEEIDRILPLETAIEFEKVSFDLAYLYFFHSVETMAISGDHSDYPKYYESLMKNIDQTFDIDRLCGIDSFKDYHEVIFSWGPILQYLIKASIFPQFSNDMIAMQLKVEDTLTLLEKVNKSNPVSVEEVRLGIEDIIRHFGMIQPILQTDQSTILKVSEIQYPFISEEVSKLPPFALFEYSPVPGEMKFFLTVFSREISLYLKDFSILNATDLIFTLANILRSELIYHGDFNSIEHNKLGILENVWSVLYKSGGEGRDYVLFDVIRDAVQKMKISSFMNQRPGLSFHVGNLYHLIDQGNSMIFFKVGDARKEYIVNHIVRPFNSFFEDYTSYMISGNDVLKMHVSQEEKEDSAEIIVLRFSELFMIPVDTIREFDDIVSNIVAKTRGKRMELKWDSVRVELTKMSGPVSFKTLVLSLYERVMNTYAQSMKKSIPSMNKKNQVSARKFTEYLPKFFKGLHLLAEANPRLVHAKVNKAIKGFISEYNAVKDIHFETP